MIWFLKPLKFPKQFNQKPYLPFLECISCLTLTPYQPLISSHHVKTRQLICRATYLTGFHMVGVSSVNELMAELGKQTERNNRNYKILQAKDKNKKPEYFVYVFVGSLMTDYRWTDDLLKMKDNQLYIWGLTNTL